MRKSELTHFGLAILRTVPSIMMMTHGFPKLEKLITGNLEFANPIGIGQAPSLFLTVIAEFLCPLLIISRVKTRLATIPLLITMAVAAFVVHGGDPFGKMELSLIYFTIFLVILLCGPGKYSIDKR